MVEQYDAGHKGRGLRASEDIAAGTVLLSFPFHGARMLCGADLDKLEAEAEACGVPHDAMITIGRYTFYDPCVRLDSPPLWYLTNHSSTPSATWRVDRDSRDAVYAARLVALRDLRRGDPVEFDYGNPDPAWETM